jgi:hypothetical protein
MHQINTIAYTLGGKLDSGFGDAGFVSRQQRFIALVGYFGFSVGTP